MIRVKDGVVFKAFPDAMLKVLYTLSEISRLLGKDVVITSGNDSKHSKKSLHYLDLAYDVRTRNLDDDEVRKLLNFTRSLGKDYDVVLENNPPHLHIEYDNKGEE